MKRQEVKEKLKECLRQFDGVDSKYDMVSETMFNIYRSEMNAIIKLLSDEMKINTKDTIKKSVSHLMNKDFRDVYIKNNWSNEDIANAMYKSMI